MIATIVITATRAQSIASVVINRGPTGPEGEQGVTGPQGVQGIQGEVGPQGPQGDPGPKGDNGSDGSSAYELAGGDGVWGDVNSWLASLVGPTGPQGEQGIQGPPGSDANVTSVNVNAAILSDPTAVDARQILSRNQYRFLSQFILSQGGTGAAATTPNNYVQLSSGTAASAYAYCQLATAAFFSDDAFGNALNGTKNYSLSGAFGLNFSGGAAAIRLAVGTGSVNIFANQNEFSSRGWGAEITHSGSSPQIRLIGHNGVTYQGSAQLALTNFKNYHFHLEKVGGNLNLYLALLGDALPTVPSLTLTGGAPTSSTGGNLVLFRAATPTTGGTTNAVVVLFPNFTARVY